MKMKVSNIGRMREPGGKNGVVKWLFRIAALVVLVVWMLVISGFSGQNAEHSGNLSFAVSCVIVREYAQITGTEMTEEEIVEQARQIEHPVRKLAHMTEYGILALLIWINLMMYEGVRYRYLLAEVGTVIFAGTDEFHQTFVDGRAGRLTDVLIDSCGGVLALLVLWGICTFCRQAVFLAKKKEVVVNR